MDPSLPEPLIDAVFPDGLDELHDRVDAVIERYYEGREHPAGDLVDIVDKSTSQIVWTMTIGDEGYKPTHEPQSDHYSSWQFYVLDQRPDLKAKVTAG